MTTASDRVPRPGRSRHGIYRIKVARLITKVEPPMLSGV